VSEERTNIFVEKMNEAINNDPELMELFAPLMVSSPAFTYYEDKKGNQYFYTKDKINHKGQMRYVAGIYRYYKTKKQYKLVRSVGFAKKKKAIEWASKQHDKAMGLLP